jgi:propionyl-CoA carboxylase beta chain
MAISKTALENLEKRRAVARSGGGADKLDARRKKGVMTARDRLNELFQAGTFQEWGLHADHDCHNFGMEQKSLPGDGVVTGTGMVDGRLIAAFSQDFTVSGGSLGRIHAKKICDLMDYAMKVWPGPVPAGRPTLPR